MKKGFTIIELVIAIALLLLAVTAVNLTFSNASDIWKLSGYKTENGAFNQAISQRIRAEGKRNVEIILKNVDTSSTPTHAYFYIYFDTADEINVCIDKAISKTQDGNFKVLGNVIASPQGEFSDCSSVSNNTGSKKYGALVEIQNNPYSPDATGVTAAYKLYKCNVTVWNLKKADRSRVDSVFYLGR